MTQEQFNTLMEGYWRSLAARAGGLERGGARVGREKRTDRGRRKRQQQYRSFVTREQLAVFLKRLRELEK